MSDHAVAPDSVHVWRGYKQGTYDAFSKFLGAIFVPACALLQPKAGLAAYVPSMMPQAAKPAGVPDQTALMFWTNKDQHDNAFKKLAVRAYSNLHGGAYDTHLSSAQFPILFAGQVKAEQPYFLIDRKADWMTGHVYHFVGGRPAALEPAGFLRAVEQFASAYAARSKQGVDAALLVAGNDYLAFWELGQSEQAVFSQDIASLAAASLDRMAENYSLPAGLWDDWPGIDLDAHSCINIQLQRPRHP